MTKAQNQNTTCMLQFSRENQIPNQDFNIVIIKAIDEVFASFSELEKQKLYMCLENSFNIKKHEIPDRIEDSVDAIEQIFGVGAKLIEIRIIEALHRRIPEFMFYPRKGDVFLKEYLASLRHFLL